MRDELAAEFDETGDRKRPIIRDYFDAIGHHGFENVGGSVDL